MRAIGHKINTLRTATAQALVKVGEMATIEAIMNKNIPKGDVFEMAKAAGLFAVKRTPDMIPDCHPIPIEHITVDYEIQGLEVIIKVCVETTYKTGVELEAMHGASVVALTIYDMLKTLDQKVEISGIKLLEKRGVKNDFDHKMESAIKTAVVVVSDSVSKGKKKDTAGRNIVESLRRHDVQPGRYLVIPDELAEIERIVKELCDSGTDLIITSGGTGFSPRDKTPEALKPILDMEIPGIMEAARNYGQQRTPYAMLSRGVAGLIGDTLILALPGSTKGAKETMDALFPSILHIFKVLSYTAEKGTN